MRVSSFGSSCSPAASRLRSLLMGVLLAAALSACADQTAMIVEVRSDELVIPLDVDSLRFQATSVYGAMLDERFDVSSDWPHSVTIVPPPGETAGRLDVTVTAFLRGTEVASRSVVTMMVPGVTSRETLVLGLSCTGATCPDGGMPDAGMPFDGGPRPDAGMFDAGMFDAGPLVMDDAAVVSDAAMADAGRDAGRPDAGRPDAGPPDAGPPLMAGLVINEVDYDQTSSDTMEYIELYNGTSGSIDLSPLDIVLVNGSTSTVYATMPLSGTLASVRYAVVTVAAVTTPAGTLRLPLTDAIQNGNPDGIVLFDRVRGVIVDAISYGGAISGVTIGGAPRDLVSGTATGARDSTTAVRSICRMPNGSDTGNDAVDWMECSTLTPGAPNVL